MITQMTAQSTPSPEDHGINTPHLETIKCERCGEIVAGKGAFTTESLLRLGKKKHGMALCRRCLPKADMDSTFGSPPDWLSNPNPPPPAAPEPEGNVSDEGDTGAEDAEDKPALHVVTALPEPSTVSVHRRYRLYSVADALAEQPPVQWVVDGLFQPGSVSMVAGDAGCKKTWAMLDIAICVAMGKEWLGKPTIQGTALYLDEESNPGALSTRIKRIMAGHQAPTELPLHFTSLAGWNLRKPNSVEELESLLTELQPTLVVIDALADVMPGADENAVKDVQPVFQTLRRLANTHRTAIVVIHHNNKTGGYRGSTAIDAALDLRLAVESRQDGSLMSFQSEKVRDTEPFRFSAEFRYDDDTGEVCLATTAAAPAKGTSAYEQRVLDYLRNGPALRQAIIDHCGGESARKAIAALVQQGRIYRSNGGGKGIPAEYALTALTLVTEEKVG